MAKPLTADVCVVGAGPAGIVTAKLLAEKGYVVYLLEKQPFPRDHVGICLSDDFYPLFEHLGVKAEMEKASFFKRQTTYVQWESKNPKEIAQKGLHVDRAKFDQILLGSALKAGVHLLQPVKIKQLSAIDNGWEVKVETTQGVIHIHAGFLVEASGKKSILPARKKRLAPPLFAIHAKWSLAKNPAFDGFIEAGESSWLWFAQVGEKKALLSIFVDSKQYAQQKQDGLVNNYLRLLQEYSAIKHCEPKQLITNVEGCDASSRYSTDPIGKNYLRVGDSNLSVDPIAAQGVYLAVSSALQAAVVIHSMLHYPEDASIAMKFYQARQAERVSQFTDKTAGVYAEVAAHNANAFWQTRALFGPKKQQLNPEKSSYRPKHLKEKLCLSTQLKIEKTAVMQNDRIVEAVALQHPNLERPISYLGGRALIPLLMGIKEGIDIESLLLRWSRELPKQESLQFLEWLLGKGILIPFVGDR